MYGEAYILMINPDVCSCMGCSGPDRRDRSGQCKGHNREIILKIMVSSRCLLDRNKISQTGNMRDVAVCNRKTVCNRKKTRIFPGTAGSGILLWGSSGWRKSPHQETHQFGSASPDREQNLAVIRRAAMW